MNTFFHNYSKNQIILSTPELSFFLIFLALAIAIFSTCQPTKNHYFDIKTTQSLRGLAVLSLILGHFSYFCLSQKMFFNKGGYWAVIIFLFISGYGLTKKYNLSRISFSFWLTRIQKIIIPLWVTLFLFGILDLFLLNQKHSLGSLFANFSGWNLPNADQLINPTTWFVGYILLLYFIYFCVSACRVGNTAKLFLLTILCLLVHFSVKFSPLSNYCNIWFQYTVVFPLGVLLAYFQFSHRNIFDRLTSNTLVNTLISGFSCILFFSWNSLLPESIIPYVNVFRPIPFVIFLTFGLFLVNKLNRQSLFLIFLGNYSYEIYLLHFPFMVKYDFFLFREPLLVGFSGYLLFILVLSYGLKRLMTPLQNRLILNE